MKKKNIVFIIIFVLFLFNTKSVSAFSVNNYYNRNLCGNYEVAGFHSDGGIQAVACFNDYAGAKNWMRSNGADDLAIMTRVNGNVKIVDANVALLDLSVNPETLTYFYNNADLSGSAYTYMDTGSLYGGVDGAHIDTGFVANIGWTAKVRIGNYTGWIKQSTYEIVPITWVKSKSSYTVTNSSIRHNYVAKIQNTYTGSAGRTIGPKPDMLSAGTYYSYDGHYFYRDLITLIKDYKNGNYNNSVNKNNPYYNYYMYLSNHTKTNYSSVNIDEYIRNNMGITQDVYGNASENGSSRLYGSGSFFYYAQQRYGVNALLSLSLSRNETGNGRSSLAIDKNNGFGLNAVDSNPYHAATWYGTFPYSIVGYASKWITNGYAHPRDWRYFGPQFGDKYIGMNVKYAADTYWSEKMAANYYEFDNAKGMQDYNYYQLGVVTSPVYAYASPSTSAKQVYKYPEAEDALVIVGEKTGTNVNGSTLWYKIICDLNVDGNFNERSGDYNWNAYVYVPASYVKKINKAKGGYTSPGTVTDYQNSEYTYDLMVTNTEFTPKVGKSTKDTYYYYDSSLQSRKNKILKNNRYVIIYSIAYDKNNNPVAYLVSSDYMYSQKDWVSASSINIVNKAYGKATVSVSGNQYTWVNSTTQDTKATLISGLYTNAYVPILEEKIVSGQKWYKVPVDLSGTTNEFGWTLASASGVRIDVYGSINSNSLPSITASNKSIVQGTKVNVLDGVSASDAEDGNITSKIKVKENNLNIDKIGTYKVVYQVTDSANQTTTKEVTFTVTENAKPVITASDITITQGDKLVENVKATDKEDGDLTSKVKKTKNTVNTSVAGTYEITYSVTDSYNQTTTKTIKVIVNGKVEIEEDNTNIDDNEDITVYRDEYVIDKSLEEKEALYTYESIKHVNENKFEFAGFIAVKGINNSTKDSVKHYIVFKNEQDNKEYRYEVANWIENHPSDFDKFDKDYSAGWFKGNVDLSDLEQGNYVIYAEVITNNKRARYVSSNTIYGAMPGKVTYNGRGYEFINNEYTKTYATNLVIRDNGLIDNNTNSNKMFNIYEDMSISNSTLRLVGMSYSKGMNLSSSSTVERTLILENTTNYKRYNYNIGSTTNGRYQIKLKVSDGLSKDRGWFDTSIDLSKLLKGTYVMYIKTKVGNVSNCDELKDITYADFNNTNKYKITRQNSKRMRLELTVN